MLEVRQVKLPVSHSDSNMRDAISKALYLGKIYKSNPPHFDYKILRKSIDARKKPIIYFIYSVCVDFGNDNADGRILDYIERHTKKNSDDIVKFNPVIFTPPVPGDYKGAAGDLYKPPIVIGSGPAGLFAAYILACAGAKPIIVERGEDVDKRQKSVEAFWQGAALNPNSNVQFGEGGAGTFSDGKLNTLTKDKFGIQSFVLETFVRHGAPEKIIYDAKPHIGTDILSLVVKSMREEIVRYGGTFLFESCATDFIIDKSKESSESFLGKVTGVVINDGDRKIYSDTVILAVGHSARDTFLTLKERGINMEKKSFAMGFRLRHPQKLINKSQYGSEENDCLEAADYKLAATSKSGRRIYSFCMCPGGYIVNASSEDGRLCVNGMSYSMRDGEYANSAIIVGLDPEDFPAVPGVSPDDALLGMYYQRQLEEKAYKLGAGCIASQNYLDFEKTVCKKHGDKDMYGVLSENHTDEVIDAECNRDISKGLKGKSAAADLTSIFTDDINEAFIDCMKQFGRKIDGFDGESAVMYAIEARTSSPVRILRDDSYLSNIKGLYPCGEGAGYAGGIMSAAVDGVKVAMSIIGRNM